MVEKNILYDSKVECSIKHPAKFEWEKVKEKCCKILYYSLNTD